MAAFLGDLVAHNKRLSLLLFVVMALFLGALGALFGEYYGNWQSGLAVALVGSVLYFLMSWFMGDAMILSMSSAREISHDEVPQLWNVVEELAIAGGTPMPRVFLIEDDALNAFATGRDPSRASVAVTRGLLEKLTREELQGVMAHEMSHVRNYDIRFAMLMAVMVGMVVFLCDVFLRSLFWGGRRRRGNDKGNAVALVFALVLAVLAPFFAILIQLAVSRQREYLADASAAELTRNPQGLISALEKLSSDPAELEVANRGTQHLFIVNPLKGKRQGRDSLFSTHPSLESRIERLRGLLNA